MARRIEQLTTSIAPKRSEQFTTVHALRGFAALWVVLFHTYKSDVLGPAASRLWEPARLVAFDYGRGGVAIFFVLSGFVITHSLWNATPDVHFFGRYILRRTIRLDPAYWVAIAATIGVAAAAGWRQGTPYYVPPGLILAHVLYAQELLGVEEIQPVFWTLTYEIQFYLVAILSLWWWSAAARRNLPYVNRWLPFALLIVAAYIAADSPTEWAPHGTFLNFWDAFAAGALAYWAGPKRNNGGGLLVMGLAVVMLISAGSTLEVFNTPAALTAIGLMVAGRLGRLNRLRWPVLQFLGTISYSLYLIHVPTIVVANSFATRTVGKGAVAFALVVISCTLAGWLLWFIVERPTHNLAKRIKPTATTKRLPDSIAAAP